MAEVSKTLEALVDLLRDTMEMDTILVDGMPANFEINKIYVIAPEKVEIEHYISSGSFQYFDVEIVIPMLEYNSDNQDTLYRSVYANLEQINKMLIETFKRYKVIGTGQLYGEEYSISQWETNGYVYTASDITLNFTSYLNT